MTLHYPAVVIKEKGRYWAYVPDLPGVYGLGATKAEAKKDLTEALALYAEDCKADGDPVPRSAAQVVEIADVALTA